MYEEFLVTRQPTAQLRSACGRTDLPWSAPLSTAAGTPKRGHRKTPTKPRDNAAQPNICLGRRHTAQPPAQRPTEQRASGYAMFPTVRLKSTGFEKYGLALGKIALQIFRLGTGHHRRASMNCVVKYPARLRLKSTGSHPLNPLLGNPIKPVHFRRGVAPMADLLHGSIRTPDSAPT